MAPRGSAEASSLRRLLDAIVTIGSDLDLSSMLRRIVEAAVELVDARYGALGVLDESKTRLAEFITVGVDDETHQAIGSLPKGLGILGSLITDARPLRLAALDDHPDSAGFPPGHPPMTSFMGVPIRVRQEVFGNLYLTDKTTGSGFTAVDEELVEALASAAGVAIANARLFEQGRRREAALAGMHEIATQSLGGLDEDEVLQLIAGHGRRLVPADLCTVVLPAPGVDGGMVVAAADGDRAGDVRGQVFPARESLSGEVVASGATVVVEDLAEHPLVNRRLAALAGAGPAVFVPLWSEGLPIGILAITRLAGAAPFSPDEQELTASFAAQVSVVIDRERGRRRLERLALLADEERIARDLHDTVIQRAFAAGLKLQGALPRITNADARHRVEDAIREIDQTVHHIRSVVFDMAAPRVPRLGVRAAVLDATRDAARLLGFEPRVVVSGPLDTALREDAAHELVAVLRDVLGHVAGYGSATEVEVDVAVADRAVLRIRENGGWLAAGDADGMVVEALQRRADKRGGQLSLERLDGTGALLEWSIPVRA